jgi:type I restriction enzyme S subunit
VRERAVDFRNWDTLARIRIPVPKLQEQRSLASAYYNRRRWADQLVGAVTRQVVLLQEHHQAIITAAVTGRLNIPEAA